MRTELQRRRRPLTWVAPAGEAEEVSASRAPHVRHSALHPAAWHGRPTAADQDPRAKGQAEEWPVLPRPADSGSAFQGCLPSLQAPSGDAADRGRNRWDPKQKSPTPRWGRDAAKASERGKGFGAQRHLPGERNRQTIYRPLRGGFTEPPRPLGRGARSQQGGRRPGSRSAARAGAPCPRASSPRTGSEAQRLQLVRAENDAGEGVEGKGAGPRVRSRALLPGEDQASSVEARTGPGSQPGRVGAPLSALPTAPKEPFCGALALPLAG